MKKILFALAVMTAMTVSCNVNIESDDDAKKENVAVDFSAYLGRATKAGMAGELTTAGLQAATAGFGVFAYYTADEPYTGASGPSFMYNEKVTWDGSRWVYEPIKYWPNQFGAAASSEEIDKVSFFAYAPYVEVTPSNGMVTGDNKSGIVALSRNSVGGDPMVKYVVNMDPGQGVDLCWGVSKNGLTASVDGNNNHVAKGAPYIDVVKLKQGDKIEYDFRHALSAINVTIDAIVDATTATAGTAVDANTKIYVRSVSFEGLATKGALNLNSTVANGPLWTDYSGSGIPVAEVLTVYDGRRDGKEGVEGAVAGNETPTGLNPVLVQSRPYGATGETAGVTKTAVNLFNSTSSTASVFVIPSNEPLKVTIVYDVETKDDKLATLLSDGVTHGSTVENAISKSIQIGGHDFSLEAGKKYNIALHIGLTSVQFDASVSTWEGGTTSTDINVPQN